MLLALRVENDGSGFVQYDIVYASPVRRFEFLDSNRRWLVHRRVRSTYRPRSAAFARDTYSAAVTGKNTFKTCFSEGKKPPKEWVRNIDERENIFKTRIYSVWSLKGRIYFEVSVHIETKYLVLEFIDWRNLFMSDVYGQRAHASLCSVSINVSFYETKNVYWPC